MSKHKIEGLIMNLHDRLAGVETSPQQARMLAQMQGQLEEWKDERPVDGDIRQTAELLMEDLEENHPKAAMVLRDIINTLHNAGL